MTDATPLASEQITQDQRAAAIERVAAKLGSMFHGQMKINLATELTDAALSASPAPSASAGAWKDAVTDALVECHIYSSEHDLDPKKAVRDLIAWEVKATLDPVFSSPAPSGQGVSGRSLTSGEESVLHGAFARSVTKVKSLAAPAPSCAPGGNYPEIPGSSCAPGEVERIKAARQWFADNGYGRLPADTARSLLAALSPQGLDAKGLRALLQSLADAPHASYPGQLVKHVYASDCPACIASHLLRQWPHATPSQRLDAATVERLTRIRTSMALLQQNSEGCALNHYGSDAETHDLPGWLADTKRDLEALTDLLATEPHQHGSTLR